MELLLASLLMVMGQVNADQPNVSFDQLVQASLDSKNAIVAQPAFAAADKTNNDYLRPVSKVDPQKDAPQGKGCLYDGP